MTQCHGIAKWERGHLRPTKSPAQGHLWWLSSYLGKPDIWSQLPLGPLPSTHPTAFLDGTAAAANLLPPSQRMSSRGQGQLCLWLAEPGTLGTSAWCCKAARTISSSIFKLHSMWFAFLSGSPRAGRAGSEMEDSVGSQQGGAPAGEGRNASTDSHHQHLVFAHAWLL